MVWLGDSRGDEEALVAFVGKEDRDLGAQAQEGRLRQGAQAAPTSFLLFIGASLCHTNWILQA